jgi:hypothetical protein|nr:MAG TPA: hypothetical protein [Caudoviricetes sp.]
MKKINEMTEQEILALSEVDVQNMIKFRMMEEGIKIVDKPKQPELFEIEPADQKVYKIPFLDGYAFTELAEAQEVSEVLRKAKSLRRVEYDWSKLGGEYKYLVQKGKYSYGSNDDFSINADYVYSNELYSQIVGLASQNRAMKDQVAKDLKAYEDAYNSASEIVLEIQERVNEVKEKNARLKRFTSKFAVDYFPLSDNNESVAIKFMSKAYSLTDEEQKYILEHYKEELNK